MTSPTIQHDRFDMPDCVRDFLSRALDLRVIDAADLWALGSNYRTDFHGLMDEIVVWAWRSRLGNPSKHSELCGMRDQAAVILLRATPSMDCGVETH